jgi:cell fate regulator YaaT (PSP1 superfamily)
MDTNNKKDNNFLSRGCCHAPQIYQNNQHIAEHRCCKLDTYDWLKDVELPPDVPPFEYAEVRFKNSRKEFYKLPSDAVFATGDIVAVEATPGHDIGIISLLGEAARLQMRKKNFEIKRNQVKSIYRRARLTDIEKWLNAVDLEDRAQLRTRQIVRSIGLNMKINDVEYQGDETKAIFYYTADERVDFRELIKLLADEFRVRIEMRQIGARQEAARLGGIGSCGMELCCATWLTDFTSVTTNTARTQQLSPNPQKLAGQCGKLKCCLNYENDVYLDALNNFPDSNIMLKTQKGNAAHIKSDIFKGIMWYAYTDEQSNMMALNVERVNEIIEANKKGELPKQLEDMAITQGVKTDVDLSNLTAEDIHRFDDTGEPGTRKKKKKSNRRNPRQQQNAQDKGNQNDQRNQKRNKPQNRPQGKQQDSSQEKSDNPGDQNARRQKGRDNRKPGGNRPSNRNQKNRNPNRNKPGNDDAKSAKE